MNRERCGPEARPEQYKIYDPNRVLDHVFNESDGTLINLQLRFAEMYAFELVLERAIELQKVALWEDPWGRGNIRRRNCVVGVT